MHQQTLSSLNSSKFTTDFRKQMDWASNTLSEQNAEMVGDQLPANVVLPTGDDIRKFKTWEMEYRTKHPKASEREVKRAVMREFNIIVVAGQNMIQK